MSEPPVPALRNQLFSLHYLLVHAERAAYEKEVNVIRPPMRFLQLP